MIDLFNANCLEVLPVLPERSVDLILCDLPYGTTACAWDTVIPLDQLWLQYRRIVKPTTAIVLTASQPFTSVLVMSNLDGFKHEWIWKKNAGSNFGAVKFQPMKEHESVLVFGVAKSRINYYPQMQERAEAGKAMVKAGVKSKPSVGADVYGGLNQGYDNSKNDPLLRYPSSVQSFNRERGLHPTQKPVALMAYLISTFTQPGETVLDHCMGSGTTGVAAKNLGRDFIGVEKDEAYFKIAETRIAAV